ncbi:ABC transporter ATP-binding protein [Amorphus orientalis]|uniref:Peptide/nickel transport system ATP-binding protein n=1 Tax=Amorphus orientalis TaxID=649198 RepID=A0AAE4AR29_9HYPH|nr:ABC transporter ATP-binding protein [Amorphus orientalis]MDQ0314726.1 peptide/nickel transport system ATP-binding protein [Amorphus orientalis]
MSVVSIRDLCIDYHSDSGTTRAVDGVSFDIANAKTIALVGESGCGKSTISQAVMGLLPPVARVSSGQILFNDPAGKAEPVDIAALERDGPVMRDIRGNRIAMIFQEPMTSLSPLHTIGDQIGEAAKLHQGLGDSAAREATREMLRLVQFPDPDRALDTYPFELSGGLRQRAMIAMALICRPALLVADEPTTALDVTIQAEILKLIRDVQAELEMSVLLITHDFGVVANMADAVVVVYQGRVMEAGPVETVFRNPQHDYLKALLKAVPTFHMGAGDRLEPIRPIAPKIGGLLSQKTETQAKSGRLLEVDGISKTFELRQGSGKGRLLKALDAVSLTVDRGECLGLVGESGSGKTTTAMAVMRALSIDSGSIRFDRGQGLESVGDLRGADLLDYRRRVQIIFQDPFSSLNPRMTLNEILAEPLVIHGIGTPSERAEWVRELMALVGLDQRYLRRYPHSLSGGQRQRVGIARALALKPDLVVCDEPVSALDVSVQAQILNLLQDLKSTLGLTYLFVSHNLAVVDYLSERVAVMCKGRLVEMGPTSEIVSDPQHPYTKALLAAVPEASLDHPLDFNHLSQSRASQPSAWPEPYRITDDTEPRLVEVSPGHFVCAPGLATQPLKEAV